MQKVISPVLYVMTDPHPLHAKYELSQWHFSTHIGLHESYVIGREVVPPGIVMHVMFLMGGSNLLKDEKQLYRVSIASFAGKVGCT